MAFFRYYTSDSFPRHVQLVPNIHPYQGKMMESFLITPSIHGILMLPLCNRCNIIINRRYLQLDLFRSRWSFLVEMKWYCTSGGFVQRRTYGMNGVWVNLGRTQCITQMADPTLSIYDPRLFSITCKRGMQHGIPKPKTSEQSKPNKLSQTDGNTRNRFESVVFSFER